jgi:hypothetical protein
VCCELVREMQVWWLLVLRRHHRYARVRVSAYVEDGGATTGLTGVARECMTNLFAAAERFGGCCATGESSLWDSG